MSDEYTLHSRFQQGALSAAGYLREQRRLGCAVAECSNPKCADGYVGNPAMLCADCVRTGRADNRTQPVEIVR